MQFASIQQIVKTKYGGETIWGGSEDDLMVKSPGLLRI
jgi:hypothetical protein